MARVVKVAVVDDDESLCRALGRVLRAAGFNPASYLSAEEFLADDTHGSADCLVLDIHLGGLSGFELRQELSRRGAVPPIIFITAHENPSDAEQAREAGCVALLYKPVPAASLLAAVRRAGEVSP